MKASVSPTAAIFVLLILPCLGFVAGAQDVVVQKDGQRREGQITGVKANILRLKVGPAETGIPMANVASVVMAAPKAFNETLVAWQASNTEKTLSLLTPLVTTYNGLPTQWAERASALLGEAYLAAGKIDLAETAFGDFQKFYPTAASTADVGLARLAIEKKDFTSARAKLVPIVEAAKATQLPATGEGAVYGQALFLLGQVQEASAENSEALESYLLAVSLFHEDEAVTKKAAERAQILAEKNVIVP
jgi:tetratricopeptide (TPR) repeat protein